MKYRPEIDGLRAIAVLPVILFHAGFELFSGGFIGVDIFFVISGYLITTIIINDIEANNFSIVNFYERRARRILPALFFVIFACLPFAWLWMLPSQILEFSHSLIAVSLFLSNIFFWQESDYFAAAAEEKPLLHTWSLAVEEQYYLLFPIFLLFAWRFKKNRVLWMIVIFALISFFISEWAWRNGKTNANFFLAPTRAWELLAGSISAFIVNKYGIKKNNFLSLLGLIAILLSILIYDDTTPFPSVYALLPILGVVLLIFYGDEKTLAGKLLGAKLFVGIGLISYSAYLWHQPLFAFARIKLLEEPSETIMYYLIAASLILAFLSWKYVEKPFRNKKLISQRSIFLSSLMAILFISSIGLAGNNYYPKIKNNWLNNQPEWTQKAYLLLSRTDNSINNFGALKDGSQKFSECRFNAQELTSDLKEVLMACKQKHGPGILILGDSHAVDLFGVISSRFDNEFLVGITRPGCRPHANNTSCQYDQVKDLLSTNSNIFNLLIHEEAGHYLLKESNGKLGTESMFTDFAYDEKVKNIEPDIRSIRSTGNYLEELSNFVQVKWFLPRAEPHISESQILHKGCKYNYSFRENQYQIFQELDDYIINYLINSKSSVQPISQNKIFNFDFPADYLNCENLYWSDGDHFSADGEVRFGKRLPNNFLSINHEAD